jgi:hypothetical protein
LLNRIFCSAPSRNPGRLAISGTAARFIRDEVNRDLTCTRPLVVLVFYAIAMPMARSSAADPYQQNMLYLNCFATFFEKSSQGFLRAPL